MLLRFAIILQVAGQHGAPAYHPQPGSAEGTWMSPKLCQLFLLVSIGQFNSYVWFRPLRAGASNIQPCKLVDMLYLLFLPTVRPLFWMLNMLPPTNCHVCLAAATTEQYWQLLGEIQQKLVPVLEPFLNRLKLNDQADPHQAKVRSIKEQILPRLKVAFPSSRSSLYAAIHSKEGFWFVSTSKTECKDVFQQDKWIFSSRICVIIAPMMYVQLGTHAFDHQRLALALSPHFLYCTQVLLCADQSREPSLQIPYLDSKACRSDSIASKAAFILCSKVPWGTLLAPDVMFLPCDGLDLCTWKLNCNSVLSLRVSIA